MGLAAKQDIIQQLQKEVISLQGSRKLQEADTLRPLSGPIEKAFHGQAFPVGAVHELISGQPHDAAATNGFIAGIVGQLMQAKGPCLWVSTSRTIFPPALQLYGIDPHRIIFADLSKTKEALWTIEEALKCASLGAVVGELSELSFKESRRLQLAVEDSHVTGFIHRYRPRQQNTVACVTRWKITALPSAADGIPGVGFARWKVELLKVRNGKPGSWQVEWTPAGLRYTDRHLYSLPAVPSCQKLTYA